MLVVAYLDNAYPWSIKERIELVNYHMMRNEKAYFYHRKTAMMIGVLGDLGIVSL